MKKLKKPIRLNVGKLIELQEEQGMNDTELAELIGVSHSTIWRVPIIIID